MPDPVYYDEDHGGSANDMMHAITGLSLMGAFAAMSIGAFTSRTVIAAAGPIGSVTVNGTRYYGLTLAQAQQVESAMISLQVARQAGVTVARLDEATSLLIVQSATAGMKQGVGLMDIGALAGIAAYERGEHAPAYDGLGGFLTYPSGNPTGNIHSLIAIGVNGAAGAIGGVYFYVHFHCEAY